MVERNEVNSRGPGGGVQVGFIGGEGRSPFCGGSFTAGEDLIGESVGVSLGTQLSGKYSFSSEPEAS